jgi:hypothetical protein
VPRPPGELLDHTEEARRGTGTRPAGQRVDAQPGEAVDQVVRRVVRVPLQQARQRVVDVAVAVLALVTEQAVHQLDGPGDSGEPGVQRAGERKAPDGSAVFLPWSALTGVRETRRLFLLLDLQDRHVRGFIPKASPGSLPPDAELGDFIRERITAGTSR